MNGLVLSILEQASRPFHDRGLLIIASVKSDVREGQISQRGPPVPIGKHDEGSPGRSGYRRGGDCRPVFGRVAGCFVGRAGELFVLG